MNALGRWARQRVALLAAAGVLLAVVLGLVVHSAVASGPPFALSDMSARVSVTATDLTQARLFLQRTTGSRLNPMVNPQQIVGRLSFETVGHREDGGQLVLFVIDNRLHKPLGYIEGVGPPGTTVSQGWDGRYERLPKKYAWLNLLASQRDASGGYSDPGTAITFAPGSPGPVTFAAVLDPDAAPVTDPSQDLTFVLAYVGDNHGAWAMRLPATSFVTHERRVHGQQVLAERPVAGRLMW